MEMEMEMDNGDGDGEESRARAKPVAKNATRGSPPLPSLALNQDFLSELQKKPPYQAIDVRHVCAKMKAWCETSGKQPSRERLINWLNREEPPKARSILPARIPKDPGRSVPQPSTKPIPVDEIIRLADELEALGLKDQARAVRQGVKPQ